MGHYFYSGPVILAGTCLSRPVKEAQGSCAFSAFQGSYGKSRFASGWDYFCAIAKEGDLECWDRQGADGEFKA